MTAETVGANDTCLADEDFCEADELVDAERVVEMADGGDVDELFGWESVVEGSEVLFFNWFLTGHPFIQGDTHLYGKSRR